MLGSLFLADGVSAQGLDTNELHRVTAGETVVRVDPADGAADGQVSGAVDIPAPAAVVWTVLVDCARASAVMPNLTSCKVLKAEPDGRSDVREHRIRWIGLLPEIRSEFESEYVEGRSIRFTRTGGDMRELRGEWRIVPSRDGLASRLHYSARVGFGALIPSFVIRNALAKDVPGFLNAIRSEAVRMAVPRTASQ
ncbi:MAG: SRPBCC family protein [Hyphomicrobium sp.]